MPKMKSNRGAAKRFSFTKTGKVKYKRSYLRHHAWAKNRKQKRRLRHPGILNSTDARAIHRLLPYG
jgi:large subunit ribosomal protein L35